jgi:hypothetical protein
MSYEYNKALLKHGYTNNNAGLLSAALCPIGGLADASINYPWDTQLQAKLDRYKLWADTMSDRMKATHPV